MIAPNFIYFIQVKWLSTLLKVVHIAQTVRVQGQVKELLNVVAYERHTKKI